MPFYLALCPNSANNFTNKEEGAKDLKRELKSKNDECKAV
jgi:hypothetical protein